MRGWGWLALMAKSGGLAQPPAQLGGHPDSYLLVGWPEYVYRGPQPVHHRIGAERDSPLLVWWPGLINGWVLGPPDLPQGWSDSHLLASWPGFASG